MYKVKSQPVRRRRNVSVVECGTQTSLLTYGKNMHHRAGTLPAPGFAVGEAGANDQFHICTGTVLSAALYHVPFLASCFCLLCDGCRLLDFINKMILY